MGGFLGVWYGRGNIRVVKIHRIPMARTGPVAMERNYYKFKPMKRGDNTNI
jgi:hypothetical protein